MKKGYVYIMKNEFYKENCLKIGFTTKQPNDRAKELSKCTGVPGKFIVIHYREFKNARKVEQKIHKIFEDKRISKGEFFLISEHTAIKLLDDIYIKVLENQVSYYLKTNKELRGENQKLQLVQPKVFRKESMEQVINDMDKLLSR